ncbi:MAG: hypothetical protein SFV23_07515, partial [Planctomycetaceae bacterium]|nr:hypothetical protein [Planctomycetaceae bacterium]
MSNSGAIKAGRAYVEIYGDQTPLQKTLASLPRGFMTASAAIGGVAGVVGGAVVGAVGAAIDAVSNLVNSYGELGGRLTDMSDRTGLSTETLGELDYAATKSGTSLDTLEGSLAKMGNKLVDAAAGSKTARAAFTTLGLSVEELSQLSPDQQFERIAQAISEIDDPAARTAAAMDVFGKSGADLLPLMKDGAEGIQAFRKEAVGLGRLSGRDVDALDQLGDTFETLGIGAYNAGATVAAAFAPVLTDLATVALPVVQTLAGVASSIGDAVSGVLRAYPPIETLTGGLAALGDMLDSGLQSLGPWGQAISESLGQAGSAMGVLLDNGLKTWQGLFDAFSSGDIGLAFEIVVANMEVQWQQWMAVLGIDWVEAWATIEDTFNQASADIASGWVSWTSGLAEFWNDLVSTIQDIWNRFTGWLESSFVWVKKLVGVVSDEVAKEQQRLIAEKTDEKIGNRNAKNESANQKIAADRQAQQQAIQQQRDARTAAIRADAET